jgi:hypothetical protein
MAWKSPSGDEAEKRAILSAIRVQVRGAKVKHFNGYE